MTNVKELERRLHDARKASGMTGNICALAEDMLTALKKMEKERNEWRDACVRERVRTNTREFMAEVYGLERQGEP